MSRSRLCSVMKVLAPMWTTSRRGISSYIRDLLKSPRYRQASGMLASAGRRELMATMVGASVRPSARACFFISGVHPDTGEHVYDGWASILSCPSGAGYCGLFDPDTLTALPCD